MRASAVGVQRAVRSPGDGDVGIRAPNWQETFSTEAAGAAAHLEEVNTTACDAWVEASGGWLTTQVYLGVSST